MGAAGPKRCKDESCWGEGRQERGLGRCVEGKGRRQQEQSTWKEEQVER